MMRIFYGKKGAGKTKAMADAANALVGSSSGNVVFLDYTDQMMYTLRHEIRFINMNEYPVMGDVWFMGFISGLISGNYDIEGIFIDGLTYILKQDISTLEGLFSNLKKLSDKHDVHFYMSINGDPADMPGFVKEYVETE